MYNTPANQIQHLKVCTWNSAGIRAHGPELEIFVQKHQIAVHLLQGTSLKPRVHFRIPVYVVFRKDRTEARGGGVAIAMKQNICCSFLQFNTRTEAIGTEITFKARPLRLILLYRKGPEVINQREMNPLFVKRNTLIEGDWNA